jgi:hypothetical protein
MMKGEEEIRTAEIIKSVIISFGASFILAWSTYILLSNRENLYLVEVEETYGKMYLDVNKRSKCGILYFPVLLLRFLLFILISSLF